MKGYTEQNKRTLTDLRKSSASIEDQLKKVTSLWVWFLLFYTWLCSLQTTKQNPKASLNSAAVGKLYQIVFEKLKTGNTKEQVQMAVVAELTGRGLITVTDEDAAKTVAGKEFSHLKVSF